MTRWGDIDNVLAAYETYMKKVSPEHIKMMGVWMDK